ncbi:MAG: hypothetical protein COB24_13755 [Hyphomicrobiales bacterium]|nr:MAG: hypothetical protein COB24_13755 [Hyphomicrobiales bacterium]
MLISVLNRVKNLDQLKRKYVTALFDFMLSLVAFCVAFIMIEKQLPDFYNYSYMLSIAIGASVFVVFIFYLLGLYKDILRYIGMKSIAKLMLGSLIGALAMLVAINLLLGYSPRRLVAIYMMTLGVSTIAMRIFARVNIVNILKNGEKTQRVLIYGVGDAGHQIMRMMKQSDEYEAVGFLDDDISKHGLKIDNIKIYPSINAPILTDELEVDLILLAMPSLSKQKRRDIIFALEDCNAKIKTLPHISELVDGSRTISDIQDIDVTELLGREPVAPIEELFSLYIENQTILVTGGAGSIGSELCRQIIKNAPKQLIILDSSEYSLYTIEQELSAIIKNEGLNVELIPILGSVQSMLRLRSIFTKYKVDTIYHAAAYKHVPLVELNIVEGISNNVFGTLNVANAAIAANVKNFTLISTDKAVRPTNVMGASKRMAELVLQALAKESHNTCFSMVRFGNVLGSSGSVVPLFKKQIEAGGPVTVTDPKISRYFMTIPEAAQLVIQAGAMAKGGEVYVLDMGVPVKIYDLARQMIHLANLTVCDASEPDGDIEIKFSGLRPGEKLYEELLIGEDVIETKHERIMSANEVCLSWRSFEEVLGRIKTACDQYDIEDLHNLFTDAPVGYNHNGHYVDLVKSY